MPQPRTIPIFQNTVLRDISYRPLPNARPQCCSIALQDSHGTTFLSRHFSQSSICQRDTGCMGQRSRPSKTLLPRQSTSRLRTTRTLQSGWKQIPPNQTCLSGTLCKSRTVAAPCRASQTGRGDMRGDHVRACTSPLDSLNICHRPIFCNDQGRTLRKCPVQGSRLLGMGNRANQAPLLG